MSFTVTANATITGFFNGAGLKVYVLTNATESGGASDAATFTGTTRSLTPNFSGSLPIWIYSNQNNTTSGVAAANNTLDANLTDAQSWTGYVGRYTGTVTSGTSLAYGISSPNTGYAVACYEVPSSGGTIAVDSSSPAVVSGIAGPSCTTASFSPPAGSVLVAAYATNNGSGTTCTYSISDTSGLGLTWTARAVQNSSGIYLAIVWTATMPGGSSAITLSDTGSGSGSETISASIPLSDSGIEADSILLNNSIALTDIGNGSSSTASNASLLLGDSGVESDSILLSNSFGFQDTGTGADSLRPVVPPALSYGQRMTTMRQWGHFRHHV